MKSYGFGYVAEFNDIEKYLCKLLRDTSSYHINNFLPDELLPNKTYVLIQDNGKTEDNLVSADCTIGLTVIGPTNDRHYTASKNLANELIVKVKLDAGELTSPIVNVNRVFGPIRIPNETRPELLVSFEIKLMGR